MLENQVDGKLTASIEGLTNTFRYRHRKPLANIPGVSTKWGKEIRDCIVADEGCSLVGADMVSLEDTTRKHYIQPLDPQYVADMSVVGYDSHLDLAKYAGKVTQGDIDKHNSGEISLKALRKKYKAANYSCQYGVGAAKLARETKVKKTEAQELIDAYWSRNWAVKTVAADLDVKVVGPYMWVRNPLSGFWHSLRYNKDRWSTVNQSTGVYCFDTWVYYCRSLGLEVRAQFHDEIIVQCKTEDVEVVKSKMKEAITKTNDKLRLNVLLDIDHQVGQTYGEIH